MIDKILIVAGGSCDREQLLEQAEAADYIIGADRGSMTLLEAGIRPDLITGDFDSLDDMEREELFKKAEGAFEVIRLIPEKDDTDTEHALMIALEKKPAGIVMMGVTGTRLDQTLSSIELLKLAVDEGVEACVLDRCNRIRVFNGNAVIKQDERFGDYISILPYAEPVDISIKGLKYEAEGLHIEKGRSRTVSNELLTGDGFIECSGYFIVFESRD